MYCSTMWYNCTVTAMSRLRIAYNNSLRSLVYLKAPLNNIFYYIIHCTKTNMLPAYIVGSIIVYFLDQMQ